MQARSCGGYDATSDGVDERLSNKLLNPEGGMLATTLLRAVYF